MSDILKDVTERMYRDKMVLVGRIEELEAEAEATLGTIRSLDLLLASKYFSPVVRCKALEAQLEPILGLPTKWRKTAMIANQAGYSGLAEGKMECADELEQALKEQGDA
jgi:hypothetical protein